MTDEEYKQLHPILSATTEHYVSLYTNAPNEKNRQKLIKLEALLHDKLEALQKARNDDD